MNVSTDNNTAQELRDAGFPWANWEPNPTALEIIEQMPVNTTLHKRENGEWQITRESDGKYDIWYDNCPHIAAAKAYIAWKKGGKK